MHQDCLIRELYMGQSCDLNFPLPEQKNVSKGRRREMLERCRVVLRDLPYGDQEQAAYELFNILYKSNKILFKADERLTLLQQIEQPAFSILDGLQEKIKDLAAPIGRKEERIAKTLAGTHFELALAYRCLLIKPPLKGVLRQLDHKSLANSLRLSIYHLGEVLRTKYNAMSNPGGAVWGYIYTLFACAYKLGVHDLKQPTLPQCRFHTVEDTFKSILLLAMSSPLTMRGTAFNRLYNVLPELAPFVELGKIHCGEGNTALSTFNLSGTEPPKKQIMSSCDPCGNASNCFVLNTDPLLNYLNRQLKSAQPGDHSTPMQQFLNSEYQLEILIRNLGDAGKADHTGRISGAGHSIETAAGFNVVHEILSGDSAKTADASAETITLEDADRWTNSGITGMEQRRAECVVMNHSSGGYCLYIDHNEKFHLWVGELAIIRKTGSEMWHPAEISWVSGNKERIEFGIKLLANCATPGVLRPINSGGEVAVECLLLAEEENSGCPARIVTASSDFAKGECLLLECRDGEYRVSVSRVQTRTNGYVEYECDCLAMAEWSAGTEKPMPDDAGPDDSSMGLGTDIDSLWNGF